MLFRLFTLTALLACPLWAQALAETKLKNVAVLAITSPPNQFTAEELQTLAGRLETELQQTGAFRILERRSMDLILQEQGFQQSGACNSEECQVKAGQLLGVDMILVGDLARNQGILSWNMRLVDVATGSAAKAHALDLDGPMSDMLASGAYEMAAILSGRKQPSSNRTVLTAKQSSIWPWVAGGLGIVALGVTTWILLDQDSKEDYKVTAPTE